ncbi:flagellar biosynthesis protein FlhA [Sandaracinobacter sp. RS1-74]|uniref:flagellar biosynthesis protein FlhA n=1 Tax=Sandaracinobacteroides sayramensis TaxID=2913411 RepID=UPI001EDC78E9|nr:flagellar biosynthesis protein FlhA [Sandaracinobacteroides sayramensis]MCG2840068.1 flagellar biosynthesis protein FlhA [Sandaracinobacteroides sayramensis]
MLQALLPFAHRAEARAWLASSLLPLAILAVVLLMVVPIPALLLDIFFVANILLSLVMLMVVLQAGRPMDFSAFPTVLLFATLFRLALNVASTRVVLVHGHEGTHAAGHVIEAFGKVLIGGNFVVGMIVFVILMIVNLAVIAKGAGRVSEVSARFTLDALPGKQMAIDADLNAGMLTPDEARARRVEVAAEADFYGSMDGASKFVKGDAVAGILILLINVVGGLIIGVVSHDLGFAEAADTYLLLSVGDALVAQIPALLLSIAAAVLVTRTTEDRKLAQQLGQQFAAPAAWWPAAAVLGALALFPAMPQIILAPAALLAAGVAWQLGRKPADRQAPEPGISSAPEHAITWADVEESASITLEIGYALIPLVDGEAPLMARITGIRRQLSQELGFILPPVRVRDDLGLAPQVYRISVSGEQSGAGEAFAADLLALEAEHVAREVPGRSVRDPAFGLNARWIDPALEQEAVAAGYTVVDSSTVIGTHLFTILKKQSYIIFSQDDMSALVENLAARHPHLAASVSPKHLPLHVTTSVCQMLLEEGVSLRSFERIASALSQVAPGTQEPRQLLEQVRARIGGLIVAGLGSPAQPLRLLTLSPQLESLLLSAQRAAPLSDYPFEPSLSSRLAEALAQAAAPSIAEAVPVALVSQAETRRALFRLLRPAGIPVLAFAELPEGRDVEVVAVVGDTLLNTESAEGTTWTPDSR